MVAVFGAVALSDWILAAEKLVGHGLVDDRHLGGLLLWMADGEALFKMTESMRLKIAVLAPIPRASERIATEANAGLERRRGWRSEDSGRQHRGYRTVCT